MKAFHSDTYVLPLPPGHRFPMPKYRLLREAAARTLPALRIEEAPPASDGELALAHEPAWIAAVAEGTMSAAQQREIGFPWSPRMVERSRRSVGATIAAARTALLAGEGVAANLAGGTHHADAHKGSGYCVFNDVAVAARLMQAEWHRHSTRRSMPRPPGRAPGSAAPGPNPGTAAGLRVIVIDLDVHQGNGTAAIFRDDPTVFTLSLHGARNFPFRKEAGDLDVELPDGCGDDEYLAALDEALASAWQRTAAAPPGLAFYLAGADPHVNDRLGRLALSAEGLAERDRRVLAALQARRIPVTLSMAGGYGHDIHETVELQRNTLALACEAWARWRAGPEATAGDAAPGSSAARARLASHSAATAGAARDGAERPWPHPMEQSRG